VCGLIGHDDNMRVFLSALASGKMHHAWILSGMRGLGKASFARIAAQKMVDPQGRHASLFAADSHPDLMTIKRLAKEPPKEGEVADDDAELKRSIGVDQIRALQLKLTTRPGLSDKRAIIIDCADDFERSAANALLKSLEEPPIGTFFFLISHSSDRLLPTIRSRCQILRFEPLQPGAMEVALAQILPDSDADTRGALARASGGSPGKAIEYMGLDMDRLEAAMTSIIETGDQNGVLRNSLAGQLSLKAAQQRYEAFLRRVPQRIAEKAREIDIAAVAPALDAWEAANILAARAIGVTLDKQSVIFQMCGLLASLQNKKHSLN
jgi:DNA polymerase-3 subunit delta'